MHEAHPKKHIHLLGPLLAIFFILLGSGMSYFVGFVVGTQTPKSIVIKGVSNMETPAEVSADFSTFWEAWGVLKEKQINAAKTDPQKMVEGAILGLTGSFNDPYTTYFNAANSKEFTDDVRGNFGGVGMEIGIKEGNIVVVAPLKDSPAERAGLKPKDIIISVDGKSVAGMSVDEAVKLIRGEIGTVVKFSIFRATWTKPRNFDVTRENIQIPTLDWKFVGNKVAYVQLYGFNENALPLFGNAVNDAIGQGAKGFIIDLRNNPGGYLESAVSIAGWLLEKDSVVVTERFSTGLKNSFPADGNGKLKDTPVVVIINSGSASAAEILAGALHDDRGVKLVGEKSFGKGTVQELIPLKDKSTIKVTIANWLTPKGTLIDKNGIDPDYKVALPDDWKKGDPDPQLNKAIEVINGEIR
jgi:carboxyl-terminal processing protease